MRMIGIMMIDGLAPSPRLLQKMVPQSVDRTQGNDFIASMMGGGYHQAYRSFRHFFGCQDPLMNAPPKKECPNVKVDEFFRWLRHIWGEAWLVGPNFSIDEQTCCMQGKSEYKTRCGKYKGIGDGIQCEGAADDGYTFDFYFRNEPADPHWTARGLCPLYSRVMHIMSRLKESGHGCNMDNLYGSLKLARAAASLPQSVQVQGVMRKNGRGVPPAVFQEDVKGKKAEAARGAVMAVVLEGDSQSNNLVIASCFDQKPFYMISNCCKRIGWDVCKKKVYSHTLGREIEVEFLRFSLSNNYNHEMNDNDMADQLRLVYRWQRFQRNQKWWWALWVWGVEVSCVNAYVMMKRYCLLKGVKMPYNHYEFQEACGYALIDPDGSWPGWNKRKPPPDEPSKKKPAPPQERKRKARFCPKTLSPTRGALKRRLDVTLDHTPMPHRKDAKKDDYVCQLHRAASRAVNDNNAIPKGARTGVATCKECQVNLCIKCWQPYHKVRRLEGVYCKILGS